MLTFSFLYVLFFICHGKVLSETWDANEFSEKIRKKIWIYVDKAKNRESYCELRKRNEVSVMKLKENIYILIPVNFHELSFYIRIVRIPFKYPLPILHVSFSPYTGSIFHNMLQSWKSWKWYNQNRLQCIILFYPGNTKHT